MAENKFSHSPASAEAYQTVDYTQSLQRIFQHYAWSETIANFIWQQLPTHCRHNLQQSLGLESASSVAYLISPLFREEEEGIVCYLHFFFSDRKTYYFNALQQAVRLLPQQTDLGLSEISRFVLREDLSLLNHAREHDLQEKNSKLSAQRYQENTARVKRELMEQSLAPLPEADIFYLLREREAKYSALATDSAPYVNNTEQEGQIEENLHSDLQPASLLSPQDQEILPRAEQDLSASEQAKQAVSHVPSHSATTSNSTSDSHLAINHSLFQSSAAKSSDSSASDWFSDEAKIDFFSLDPISQSIDLVAQWEEQLKAKHQETGSALAWGSNASYDADFEAEFARNPNSRFFRANSYNPSEQAELSATELQANIAQLLEQFESVRASKADNPDSKPRAWNPRLGVSEQGDRSALSKDSVESQFAEAPVNLLTEAETSALAQLAQVQELRRRELVEQNWLKDSPNSDRQVDLKLAAQYFSQLARIISENAETKQLTSSVKEVAISELTELGELSEISGEVNVKEVLAKAESRGAEVAEGLEDSIYYKAEQDSALTHDSQLSPVTQSSTSEQDLSAYYRHADFTKSLQSEAQQEQVRRDYVWLQRVLQSNLASMQGELKHHLETLRTRFIRLLKEKFPLHAAQAEVNKYFSSLKLSERFSEELQANYASSSSRSTTDNLRQQATYHQQLVPASFWSKLPALNLDFPELVWLLPLESFLPAWQERGLELSLALTNGKSLVANQATASSATSVNELTELTAELNKVEATRLDLSEEIQETVEENKVYFSSNPDSLPHSLLKSSQEASDLLLHLESGNSLPISALSLEWNLNAYLLKLFQQQLSDWESFVALVGCLQDLELVTNSDRFVEEVSKLIDLSEIYQQLWQELLDYLNLELIYVSDLHSLAEHFALLPQTQFADLKQKLQLLDELKQQELAHTLEIITNRVSHRESQALQQQAQHWLKQEQNQQQELHQQFFADNYGIVANSEQGIVAERNSKLVLQFILQSDLASLQQNQHRTISRLSEELAQQRAELARFEQEFARLSAEVEVELLEADPNYLPSLVEQERLAILDYLKHRIMASRNNIYRLEQDLARQEEFFRAEKTKLEAQLAALELSEADSASSLEAETNPTDSSSLESGIGLTTNSGLEIASRFMPEARSIANSKSVADLESELRLESDPKSESYDLSKVKQNAQPNSNSNSATRSQLKSSPAINQSGLSREDILATLSSDSEDSEALADFIALLTSPASPDSPANLSDYERQVSKVKESLDLGVRELEAENLDDLDLSATADKSKSKASVKTSQNPATNSASSTNLWRSLEINLNDLKLKAGFRKQLLAEREIIREAESQGYDPLPLLQKSQQLYEQKRLKQQKWAQDMALRRKAKQAGLTLEEYLKQLEG